MTHIGGISDSAWTRYKDIITLLVVPAMGWVMLQIGSMSRMQVEVETLKASVSEARETIQYLRDRDNNVSLQIARLEARFEATESLLVDLKKSIEKVNDRIEKLDARIDELSQRIRPSQAQSAGGTPTWATPGHRVGNGITQP